MCLAWRELQTNKLCQHSVCSLKSLSRCISLHRRVSAGLCLSNTATWLISSFPISYILRFLSFPSFTSSLPPSLHATSPPPFPPPLQSSSARAQAGRQAGCPAGGPDGALASQPALGLWACRTAGRPFCGRYGRGQSWHLSVTMDQQGDGKARTQKEPCQYTADWETVEGRTHTPTCDWAAVLSLTTRRCTEYEIEGRLTWLVFKAFSVMQLHLRIIILLMRGNHIGKNSCIFLIDFWIFCYHNMPFFNQIKKIHQNTHLGFCT